MWLYNRMYKVDLLELCVSLLTINCRYLVSVDLVSDSHSQVQTYSHGLEHAISRILSSATRYASLMSQTMLSLSNILVRSHAFSIPTPCRTRDARG